MIVSIFYKMALLSKGDYSLTGLRRSVVLESVGGGSSWVNNAFRAGYGLPGLERS